MKQIAVVECYPNRAPYIVAMLKRADPELNIVVFRIYKDEFPDVSFDGYVFSGGAIMVSEINKHPELLKLSKLTKTLAQNNKPILALCLGHHVVTHAFGGKVERRNLETGFVSIEHEGKHLLENVANPVHCFSYHADYVVEVPQGFEVYASTPTCKVQAMKKDNIFTLQFHPEITDKDAATIFPMVKKDIEREGFEFEELVTTAKNFAISESIKIFRNFLKRV